MASAAANEDGTARAEAEAGEITIKVSTVREVGTKATKDGKARTIEVGVDINKTGEVRINSKVTIPETEAP